MGYMKLEQRSNLNKVECKFSKYYPIINFYKVVI